MTGLLLAIMLSTPVQPSAETHCMAFTIMREAEGESKRGKRAVLDVLRNRMAARGKKCRAIVAEKRQWSWYRRKIVMRVSRSRMHSYEKLRRMQPVLSKEYLWFFRADMPRPSWSKGMVCKRVDRHLFCRVK